jgi:Xaa-Pro aminopeptidase
MTTQEKIAHLREAMQQAKLDAYVLPHADPHGSEYLPEHWRIMPWLTGFTGSAGTVVLTADFAGLWTDSRYFIQAEAQLKDSGFELMKLKVPHTPEYQAWLVEQLPRDSRVGIDARLLSLSQSRRLAKRFGRHNLTLIDAPDLIDAWWKDRPLLPSQPIEAHRADLAGINRRDKLAALREKMKAHQATHHLVSSLDDIAWTLNLRGSDVAYNPVFMAYLVVDHKQAILFVDPKKLSPELKAQLAADGVRVDEYEGIAGYLGSLSPSEHLLVDPAQISLWLSRQWKALTNLEEATNPSTNLKAVKNATEIQHLRQVMIRDGIALLRFLRWLEAEVGQNPLTEVSVAERLEAFRQEQLHYVGPSFGTIAGYEANGAIVHYSAEPETAAQLEPRGILLLDSGGQYRDGTTDITRTIALGEVSGAQRRDFTLVLKGHIGLATAIFPQGTTGVQLDGYARRPLWDHLVNFGHGTGHGVGFFLNVHEGPQRISPSPSASEPFKPGMLTSNEPGLYHQGHYGIRIENLILCVEEGETEHFGKFLGFETLSLCPIDLRLVDKSLLHEQELIWLNRYHAKVYEALAPHLSEDEKAWLRDKTTAI